MRPLERDELLDLERYEALRADYRARVIALKRDRRVGIGDRVTLVFENRETLRFQVQEMLRVERIRSPEAVQAELDVYNELMPAAGELSATLFIEITETSRIRQELDRLVGIDAHVALVLGEGPEASIVRARFDPRQMDEDRISAVHYLRFRLAATDAALLRDETQRARLRIDHPHYRHDAEVSPALRAQVVADLDGRDPRPLLDAGPAPAARRSETTVLEETDAARVLRPAGTDEIVVVCRSAVSFPDAPAALVADVLAVVQRYAAEVLRRSGSCRIASVVEGGPMRWVVKPGAD